MNQIDLKLSKFIKGFFNLPHKLFAFPYKNKIGENGIIYANQFLRTSSVLLDLTLIIIVLQLFFYVFSIFFTFPIELIEKYRLGLEVTEEDKIAVAGYYKGVFTVQILQLAAVVVYVVFMWHKYGGTPGKLLFKLRIVDEKTLQNPSILQCLKRFLVSPISILCLLLGIIWQAFDKKARTWHDIASGTVVVMKKSLKKS